MSINIQDSKKVPKLFIKYKNQINKLTSKEMNNNEQNEKTEESPNELLSKILDKINTKSLNEFYPDSNNEFKKKIDSLNLEFYLETEKFLSNKHHSINCQTSLFIILFRQINIYIEEIGRLNLIIMERKYDPEKIVKRTDEIIKKQNEFITKENLIKALKDSKTNLENKLLQAIINENKLKKEIENLKKEKELYKNRIINIKNEIPNGNCVDNKIKIAHKLTYSLLDEKKNIKSYSNKKHILLDNEIRKRNNSDNNKFILNNSLYKFDKNGKTKLKIKNQKNMYNQNTMSSTTKFQSKKISIKLTDRNSDVNYEYKGFNNDKNNMQNNSDNNNIIYVKTENNNNNNINEIKSRIIYEYNNNKKDKMKKKCESKNKEINSNNKKKN